jgi:hypothetical protein
MLSEWQKYRLTMEGGRKFVEQYLTKFSTRESNEDFNLRRSIAHCSAHAKAALVDVKSTIYNRLPEVSREGGGLSYKAAVSGQSGGVDGNGSTMDGFIGQEILMDLLGMGKVGIVVDREPLPEGFSRAEAVQSAPYAYSVAAEDILNWRFGPDKELEAVYFRVTKEETDEYGLVADISVNYNLYTKISGAVEHIVFDASEKEVSSTILNLEKLPIIIVQLSQSLLADICEIQMALTNMHSSDIVYAQEANYPFYTEQYIPGYANMVTRSAQSGDGTTDGEAAEQELAKETSVTLGATKGRRYPKGMDRPEFINPSSEPLKASMEKEEQLKAEIRQLMNLGLANLVPLRASSDSKQKDKESVEAGVVVVAQELQKAEVAFAEHWHRFLGETSDVKIIYPSEFSVKSETERVAEARQLIELAEKLTSPVVKREIHAMAARNLLRNKLDQTGMETLLKDIRASKVILSPKDMIEAVHEGIASAEFASTYIGFPAGETEKAQKEHADRLARIAVHQQKGMGARGVADLGGTDDGNREKRGES